MFSSISKAKNHSPANSSPQLFSQRHPDFHLLNRICPVHLSIFWGCVSLTKPSGCGHLVVFSIYLIFTWLGRACARATPSGCRWVDRSWGRSRWRWRPRRATASSVSRICREFFLFTFPSRVEEGRRRKFIWMKNPLRSHNLTISSGAILSQNLSPGRRRSNVRNGI